jgi:hypothetical protein
MIEVIIFVVLAGIFIFWQQHSEHQKIQEKLQDALRDKLLPVSVEVHNGVIYWFNSETDRFISQGNTDKEIIADIKQRFPNNIFMLPNGTAVFGPLWEPTKIVEVDK